MALEGKTTVMKWFVIILFAFTSLGSAEDWTVQPDSDEWRALFDPPFTTPTEISADTPLRKQLFDLLRPHIERERKASKGAIRFQGDLKAFKNWAFFMGITFDQNGEPYFANVMAHQFELYAMSWPTEDQDALVTWIESETATYYRGVAIREIHDMVREVAERSQTLLQAA